MTTEEALQRFDNSPAKLAKALGVVPSAVGNWKVRGLPKQQALELERRESVEHLKKAMSLLNEARGHLEKAMGGA